MSVKAAKFIIPLFSCTLLLLGGEYGDLSHFTIRILAPCLRGEPFRHRVFCSPMAKHLLAGIPLFCELSESELGDLEPLLTIRDFVDRKPIFWVGDRGDEFFLVRSGKVDISCPDESGREVLLATLSAGQFFGEISLLDAGPRTATALAHGLTQLYCLAREQFIQFLRSHPDAAIHMLTVLGRRQRETLEKVRGIRNLNDAMERQRTSWHAAAERIASVTATQGFIIVNLVFFGAWVILNLALKRWRMQFDGDHFDLLALLVTIEALFISLFVLISQKVQSERDRLRADLDYQVNVKAHQEVMTLQQKLDRLAETVRNSATSEAAEALTHVPPVQ